MRNVIYIIVLLAVLLIGYTFVNNSGSESTINSFEECVEAGNPVMESYPRQCQADGQTFTEDLTTTEDMLTDENAELVGFQFIQDFIASAPPNPDPAKMESAYNALSQSAKEGVSTDTISRDLAQFIGVQDVPDQGASVENLEIINDSEVLEAHLTVGLNYSGGRIEKLIILRPELGEWKVDSVENVESNDEGVYCAQDVQECPDGSFVSRIPPSCDFAACPVE